MILVKRELNDSISNKVKKRNEESLKIAKARPIKMLDAPPKQGKSAPKGNKNKKVVTKSTSLHVRHESLHSNGSTSNTSVRVSPRPTPTPTPIPIPKAAPTEAQALMRHRLVHFLAINPRTSAEVIQTVGGGGKSDVAARSHISTLLSQVSF